MEKWQLEQRRERAEFDFFCRHVDMGCRLIGSLERCDAQVRIFIVCWRRQKGPIHWFESATLKLGHETKDAHAVKISMHDAVDAGEALVRRDNKQRLHFLSTWIRDCVNHRSRQRLVEVQAQEQVFRPPAITARHVTGGV